MQHTHLEEVEASLTCFVACTLGGGGTHYVEIYGDARHERVKFELNATPWKGLHFRQFTSKILKGLHFTKMNLKQLHFRHFTL